MCWLDANFCLKLAAELMVIKWGMQKACDDGIPKSEVEVDSQLIKWRRGSTLEAAEFV